ncbi:MAG: O-antigen ligase family protein [Flavobacterium sp.]|nr:O-antigen ligase family protein [Flavobacterium sp.]
MQIKEKNYLLLILSHILIGILISYVPFLSKVYGLAIPVICLFFVVKTRNKNHEVIYACAYIIGSEVFLRMTNGSPNYEFAKYSIIAFSIIGMFYSGFSKNAVPYWIFLILLIPGVIIATESLNIKTNIRTTISFNISGPLSLGFLSLYTFNKKINISQLNNILLLVGLPIVSCATYLFFFASSIKSSLSGTSSNFILSGGFGPNQVSTVLGLGMFVFISRVLLVSRTKLMLFVNFIIAIYCGYRGILTFSRGGMITAVFMIIVLLIIIFLYSKKQSKLKLVFIFGFMIVSISGIWIFSAYQTGGLVANRYANKDALGRKKSDVLTGRGDISNQEINLFLENPIFGIGVGKGSEIRKEQTSEVTASHNEITRLLAEHGSFGILALLILFITPLVMYIDNKEHIYMLCFLIFWLLTINHAAMRTAAPSFVYALTLLKVKFNE